jgi:hypothetical protein
MDNLPMEALIFGSAILYLAVIWLGVYLMLHKLDISQGKRIFINVAGAVFFAGWYLLGYELGKRGTLIPNPSSPPIAGFLGFTAPMLVVYLLYRFSPTIHEVIDTAPLPWLLLIQIERVMALNFFYYYSQGKLPAVFAFSSATGDILTALAAPFVAYFYYRKKSWSRKLAVGWNIFGLLDLVTAGIIGFLAATSSIRMIYSHPSTNFIVEIPLIMLFTTLVPLAFMFHIFSLIRLSESS